MPALGMITGQIDFSDLKIVLKAAVKEGTEIIEMCIRDRYPICRFIHNAINKE